MVVMATPDSLRPVARSLTAGLRDFLPVVLWDKSGSADFGAPRRMSASELRTLVSLIKEDDKSEWTLRHLIDIASAVSNEGMLFAAAKELAIPLVNPTTQTSTVEATSQTTGNKTPKTAEPNAPAPSNKPFPHFEGATSSMGLSPQTPQSVTPVVSTSTEAVTSQPSSSTETVSNSEFERTTDNSQPSSSKPGGENEDQMPVVTDEATESESESNEEAVLNAMSPTKLIAVKPRGSISMRGAPMSNAVAFRLASTTHLEAKEAKEDLDDQYIDYEKRGSVSFSVAPISPQNSPPVSAPRSIQMSKPKVEKQDRAKLTRSSSQLERISVVPTTTKAQKASVKFKAPGAKSEPGHDKDKSKTVAGRMTMAMTKPKLLTEPKRKARMRGYSAGDIARVLRLTVGTDISRAESLFNQFDFDFNNTLSGDEFGELIQHIVGEQLTTTQLDSLFDMMAESHETVHLSDFIDFFCSPELGKDTAKFSVVSRSTVTAVDISADEKYVVFGGTDCAAKMYGLQDSSRILNRKFAKGITSIVISSNGDRVGVSCFGGTVQWVRASSDKLIYEWAFEHEALCLALGSDDSVLAVGGADHSVRLYDLNDGAQVYRFYAGAPVRSICMAEGSSFSLEIADGIPQNMSLLSDVSFPAGITPKIAAESGDFFPVVLQGTVMHRSDEVDHSEWTALLKVLQSRQSILIMSALVVVSCALTLLFRLESIQEDAPVFQNFVSLAFFIEYALRGCSHKFSDVNMALFVVSPLNWLDACIICVEVVFFVSAMMNGGDSLRDPTFTTVLRLLKIGRATRLLNICRSFEKAANGSEHDAVEHDILLSDGTLLKNIPNRRLSSIDAKSKLAQQSINKRNPFKKMNSGTTKILRNASREVKSHAIVGAKSIHRAARRASIVSAFNKSVSPLDTGQSDPSQSERFDAEPSKESQMFDAASSVPQRFDTASASSMTESFAAKQVAVLHGAERLAELKRTEEYDEGTPVEVRALARMHKIDTAKFVAVGSEDQKAAAWQFDMSIDQSLIAQNNRDSIAEDMSLARRGSVEDDSLRRRNSLAPLTMDANSHKYHIQAFTHTVNR